MGNKIKINIDTEKLMGQYLSNKITFFSFWLIILVVLLHSLNIQFTECSNLICSFQYLLSHKLAQIAVPLFFFISGYLYFLKANFKKKIDLSFFINNNKKRVRTILLPYILWSVLWFLLLYTIQLVPFLSNYFGQPLYSMSLNDKLLNLLVYPLNYPFWFLRELMLLCVLSPLLFIGIQYLKYAFIALLFVASLFISSFLSPSDVTLLQSLPVLYFSLGAFFSLNKLSLIDASNKFTIFLLILTWFSFNILSVYFDKELTFNSSFLRVFNIIKDLIGCYTVWSAYDYFNQKRQWKNYSFYQYSFFIFAFHGIPTLLFVKLSQIFKNNEYYLFGLYLIIFISIIVMSVTIAKVAQLKMPTLYKLLIGNR